MHQYNETLKKSSNNYYVLAYHGAVGNLNVVYLGNQPNCISSDIYCNQLVPPFKLLSANDIDSLLIKKLFYMGLAAYNFFNRRKRGAKPMQMATSSA